jgi:hypothetical protein
MTPGEIGRDRDDPNRSMDASRFEPERLEDVMRPRERPEPDGPDNDGPEPDGGMER